MATTTRTRKARTADTAPKGMPRDLDQSDVDADAQRMADELAAREAAAAKPAPRRSRKATPAAPAETAPEAAPAPRKARSPKADAPQPQQPAQPVEAAKVAQTPKLDQAATITAFLAAHPDEAFSPHQISKATTPEGRKRLGLRDACARLAKADKIAQVSDKPLKYRAMPAA